MYKSYTIDRIGFRNCSCGREGGQNVKFTSFTVIRLLTENYYKYLVIYFL